MKDFVQYSPWSMRGSSYTPILKSSPTCKMQSRVLNLDSPIALHPWGSHFYTHTSFPVHLKHQVQSSLNTCLCTYILPAVTHTLDLQAVCSFISFSLWSNVISPEGFPWPAWLKLHPVTLYLLTLNFLQTPIITWYQTKHNLQRVKKIWLSHKQASSGTCQWFI